jgi:hypothetical protein
VLQSNRSYLPAWLPGNSINSKKKLCLLSRLCPAATNASRSQTARTACTTRIQSRRSPSREERSMDTAKGKKRPSGEGDDPARKKAKSEASSPPKYNPYLAHMDQYENYEDGYQSLALDGLKRRQTTAKQAAKAEDEPVNPWTGRAHTQKYFDILRTRRDLPVHKQRYAYSIQWRQAILRC